MRIFPKITIYQNRDVFTAFYPVYILGWLLGIVPVEIKGPTGKRIVVKSSYGIYTYLVMSILISSYVLHMIAATRLYFFEYTTVFQVYLGTYYLILSTILSFSVIVTKIMNKNNYKKLWNMILRHDKIILELSGTPISDTYSCIFSVTEIIVSVCSMLRLYYFSFYSHNTIEQRFLLLCTIASNIYREYIKIEIELWMMLIATRFRVLNKVLIVSILNIP